MSAEYKVPYTKILDIKPHPNADRLEIAVVYGFNVIVQKDRYKVGDKIIYVPIDSILHEKLENELFPEGSKITLHHHRVRQIKIRQVPSQGMVIAPEDLKPLVSFYFLDEDLEKDFSEALGITKYEPPQRDNSPKPPKLRNKPKENTRFHKYGGVTNIKWYPSFFEGKEVVIQEKCHGSNCRASYQRSEANTFWKKILKLFGCLPEYEYCYGSNNVQLQNRWNYKGYYGADYYGAVLKKVDAFSKLKPGETIFGELLGPGIQKGYEYGLKEHHFVLFDVKTTREDGSQEFLDPEQAEAYAKERGFDFVPVVYVGSFDKDITYKLSKGPSDYCKKQKVKEGIVIKLRHGYGHDGSKEALKLLNEDYLNDPTNTDFQ